MTVENIAPVIDAEAELEAAVLSLSAVKCLCQSLAGSDAHDEPAQAAFYALGESIDGICKRLGRAVPGASQY